MFELCVFVLTVYIWPGDSPFRFLIRLPVKPLRCLANFNNKHIIFKKTTLSMNTTLSTITYLSKSLFKTKLWHTFDIWITINLRKSAPTTFSLLSKTTVIRVNWAICKKYNQSIKLCQIRKKSLLTVRMNKIYLLIVIAFYQCYFTLNIYSQHWLCLRRFCGDCR